METLHTLRDTTLLHGKLDKLLVKSNYLLLNDIGGLIVEDGSQAVGVSGSFWIQANVQGHKYGGELVPEVFFTLQSEKKKTFSGVNVRNGLTQGIEEWEEDMGLTLRYILLW